MLLDHVKNKNVLFGPEFKLKIESSKKIKIDSKKKNILNNKEMKNYGFEYDKRDIIYISDEHIMMNLESVPVKIWFYKPCESKIHTATLYELLATK